MTAIGRVIDQKKLISGTIDRNNEVQNGVWEETQYSNFADNGKPKTTVEKSVALYDPNHAPSSPPTSPVDLTTTVSYDAFGNLLSETDAVGNETDDTYDLAGDLVTSTAPEFAATVGGNQVQTHICEHHTYDAWNEETADWQTSSGDTTAVKASWTTSSYDACGRALQEKSWLWTTGNQTPTTPQSTIDCTYDGLGHEITSDNSTIANPVARSVYDARGNVITAWDEGVSQSSTATATVSTYDAQNQLTLGTAPGESTATTDAYTANGNVLTETSPDGDETDHTYDAAGNVTKLKDNATSENPGPAVTTSTYDLGGRLISETDQSGLTTSYTYDLLDRQLSAGATGQQASQTTDNTLGWVLSTTDADGIVSSTVYDADGRATTQTTAGETSHSTFDAAGHLTEQKDPNDKWVNYQYDCFANTTRETHTVPGTPRVTVKDTSTTYDSLGRPSQSSDSCTHITHGWLYPLDVPGTPTETLTVDASGKPVASTVTTGGDGYEASRSTVIDSSNPQLPNLVRTIDNRDNAQQVSGATCTSGNDSFIGQWSYDEAGRLQRQWGTTGGGSGFASSAQSTDAYTYDNDTGLKVADDLKLTTVGTPPGLGVISNSYIYTADGRLAEATIDGSTSSYTFDSSGNGNLKRIDQGSTTTTFTYDADQLLTTSDGTNATCCRVGIRPTAGAPARFLLPRPRRRTGRSPYSYTATGRLAFSDDSTTDTDADYACDATGQRPRERRRLLADDHDHRLQLRGRHAVRSLG